MNGGLVKQFVSDLVDGNGFVVLGRLCRLFRLLCLRLLGVAAVDWADPLMVEDATVPLVVDAKQEGLGVVTA